MRKRDRIYRVLPLLRRTLARAVTGRTLTEVPFVAEVKLSDLGVESDPGTEWHPRPSKVGAFMSSGDLPDLDDLDVLAHSTKPEEYPDSGRVLAAEDSGLTPEGEI